MTNGVYKGPISRNDLFYRPVSINDKHYLEELEVVEVIYKSFKNLIEDYIIVKATVLDLPIKKSRKYAISAEAFRHLQLFKDYDTVRRLVYHFNNPNR